MVTLMLDFSPRSKRQAPRMKEGTGARLEMSDVKKRPLLRSSRENETCDSRYLPTFRLSDAAKLTCEHLPSGLRSELDSH
jgi:hypothetical protein